MKRSILKIITFGFAVILVAACNLPTKATPTGEPNLSSTQAAQTLEALMTQVAGAATVTPGSPTNTPQPQAPTATIVPPTATQAPTSSPVPLPCDSARFVTDISIPDGTNIVAGTRFVKTWRLKNVGTCTWTTSYSLVFTSGNAMGSPASFPMPTSVSPDQNVDISVELVAPSQTGSYRGNWMLRNASGQTFGLGSNNETFYADIKVTAAPPTDGSYNFAANYCAAEWTTGAGTIPCTTPDKDAKGFVIYKDKPYLESGTQDNEAGIVVGPQNINDGIIRGKYTVFNVKANDHFKAVIGCEYNAKDCDVKFQLDYQIDNGAIQTLATWSETYDGNFQQVDVDLTSLAGKSVKFILTVMANGSATGDRALWLAPRIVNITP
jgi:hypothetical protein